MVLLDGRHRRAHNSTRYRHTAGDGAGVTRQNNNKGDTLATRFPERQRGTRETRSAARRSIARGARDTRFPIQSHTHIDTKETKREGAPVVVEDDDTLDARGVRTGVAVGVAVGAELEVPEEEEEEFELVLVSEDPETLAEPDDE